MEPLKDDSEFAALMFLALLASITISIACLTGSIIQGIGVGFGCLAGLLAAVLLGLAIDD